MWPFDDPKSALLVEIYPRLLTASVRKSSQLDREAYLQRAYPTLSPTLASAAAGSEDAFDAALSALVMRAHCPLLLNLRRTDDSVIAPGGTDLVSKRGLLNCLRKGARSEVRPVLASRNDDRATLRTDE